MHCMIVALYLIRMYYKQYSKFMHAEESDGSIAWACSCMIAGSQF
jgi:hypothetical protein